MSEATTIKTYKCFKKHGVLTSKKMLKTGLNGLVSILDARAEYSGNLDFIHGRAFDSHDLEGKMKDLGKGIGDVTVTIFLGELRDVWAKARAAEKLGILRECHC